MVRSIIPSFGRRGSNALLYFSKLFVYCITNGPIYSIRDGAWGVWGVQDYAVLLDFGAFSKHLVIARFLLFFCQVSLSLHRCNLRVFGPLGVIRST